MMGLERKSQGQITIFITKCQEYIYDHQVDLASLAEVVTWFLYCKSTPLYSPFILYSSLFSLIYAFIYLWNDLFIKVGFKTISFIFLGKIQYDFTYFVALAIGSFQWTPVFLWHTSIIVGFFCFVLLFSIFLTFLHYKMLQAHCLFTTWVLESAISPRIPGSFY